MNEEEKTVNFKIWWDEENQVARFKMFGTALDAADAIQIKAQSVVILNDHQRAGWIVDIKEGKDYPSPEVRVALTDMARQTESGKMAFIVGSKVMEKTAAFMMKIIGRDHNLEFFTDEQEALAWLKGN